MYWWNILWLSSIALQISASEFGFDSRKFADLVSSQDDERRNHLLDRGIDRKARKQFKSARDRFYKISAATMEEQCKVVKRVGKG